MPLLLFPKQIFGSILKSRKKQECGTRGQEGRSSGQALPTHCLSPALPLLLQSWELHERFLLAPCIFCAAAQYLCTFACSPRSLISVLENAVLTVHRPWNGEWQHHWAWEQEWLQLGHSAGGGRVWPASLSPPRRCMCASLPCSAGKLQERSRPCSSASPGSLHTSLAEAGSTYTKPWLDATCSLKSPSFTGRPLKSACPYLR